MGDEISPDMEFNSLPLQLGMEMQTLDLVQV